MSGSAMAKLCDIGDGVVERTVWIDGDGGRLAGVLSEPAGAGPVVRPVLIVHGWGSYRTGPHGLLVRLSREIARSGARALRFDLRGRGESEGAFDESDLDGMIDDTRVAAEWLARAAGCDAVSVIGMCSGGNIAAATAALGSPISRLVVVGMLPYQSEKPAEERSARRSHMLKLLLGKIFDPESWRKLLGGRIRWGRVLGNLSGREAAPGGGASAEARNLKDSSRDIPAALAEYQRPILFVYGGGDQEAGPARAHFSAFAERHRLDAYFRVVEGANHNFYSAEWTRELIEKVLDFLAIER